MNKESDLKVIWSNKNFCYLFIGKFLSSVGDQIYLIGLPLLALKMTGSGLVLSLVVSCEYIAKLLASFGGGALADRLNKKYIMILSALMQSLIVGFIYVLSNKDLLSSVTICILAALVAASGSFYSSAETALLPTLFDKKHYTAMNSQFNLINTTCRLIGPVVAGGLIGVIGVQKIFLIDSLSFIILIILVGFISISHNKLSNSTKKESLFQSIKAGFVFLQQNNFLIKIALGSFLTNIALGPILSLLVYFAQSSLHASSLDIGIIYACGSIGGLTMGFLAPRLKKRFNNFSTVFLINILLLGLGILLLGTSFNIIIACIANFIIISMVYWYNVSYNTIVQEFTPSNYMGRISSVMFIVSQISLPLSISLAGILTNYLSIKLIYSVLGIFMVIIGLIFYTIVYKSIDAKISAEKQVPI
ncbi:MFS transporter [Priestia megaterium]|uniref:MFS transporter n=1 Tax=Priestia megaterium TaxID=1404 RepID=UPI002D808560|nr:MFS transporter [Priestia megaterium]MEB4861271.1 MFS transporter [Priestia megaterium]